MKNIIQLSILSLKRRVKEFRSKKLIKKLLVKNKIYLEIGAGNKAGKNGWTTIDMTENCDIFWDLRKGIPFPNESVSKIYSSHFMEHLSYNEGQKFLNECFRVLMPGGLFSICVPNAKIYIEAYINSTINLSKYCRYQPAYNNTTKIDYINYTAYMDGHHKYMFDEENLLHILNSKGFKKVHLRDFDCNLDIIERDYESIYAVGFK